MGQETEYSYKPGTIRSIKLSNFMCHESFELNLGPRVNFVIGPNGSGKSALLTALVVVLGGRATTTSRAKKASEFVMYGKKCATITCIIHNYEKIMEKEQAFKPDEYGKRIVVEKIIYSEETSRLIMKNDKGKKVSERSQELHDMLDHFSILINNPVCILNQEVSKNFLHSKKPEDKFQLFMKATNLEQIQLDYEDAKSNHTGWKSTNDRKAIGFKLLDVEYSDCKEKVSFLMNRAKLQDNLHALTRELVWAMIRDLEQKAIECQRKIDEIAKSIEGSKSKSERSKDLIEKSKLRIEQQKERKQTCDQECEASRKKLDENRRKDTVLRTQRVDVEQKIQAESRKIERYERDKASLENTIKDLRKKLTVDTSAEENERRKLEIQQLDREISSEKAREKTIRQHTDQLAQSMSETRGELHKMNARINNISNELSQKHSALRRLRSGEVSALGKYGDHISTIVSMIQAQADRFQKKPLGPLGIYVRLNSQDVARALELHLGRNAYAFTCDNINDSQLLQRIIKDVKQNSTNRAWFEPLVLIRKHTGRHNTSQNKAHHDRYKTLLDYMEIEEDAVYNVLVDRTSLETALFIPDFTECENLMISPPLIPQHTRVAYTKDCHQMYPRTQRGGYRCIANRPPNACLFSMDNADEIRQSESQIANLEAELRDCQANKKRLDESYDVQRKEHDNNYSEIRKIQDKISKMEHKCLELKTTLTHAQPEELSAFEAELETFIAKIADCKREIERESSTLAKFDDERKELASEKEGIMAISKKRDAERQKVIETISAEENAVRSNQDIIADTELELNSLTAKKTKEMEDLEKHRDDIAAASNNVDEGDRPSSIRETSAIKSEMEIVKRQLRTEIEENQDPDELLAQLRKRMSEIENLTQLRGLNENNFQKSSLMLKDRDDGFKSLRSNVCGSVATTFASVMRAMNMNGVLRIHLDDFVVDGHIVSKAKTLEMSVDPTPSQRSDGLSQNDTNRGDRPANRRLSAAPFATAAASGDQAGPRIKRARVSVSQPEKENCSNMTDTRSLSGGERSFSTVAFVLALWHHCSSPFKLMDEIDVFMDLVTRRMSYSALIRFAKITDSTGQFIFFTPLDLPQMDEEDLVRVFELPKIIRSQQVPPEQCAS